MPSPLAPVPAARLSGLLPSHKQAFQRALLHRMLLGVGLLELLQVDQLPANCRQTRGFRQADKAEVGCGIVKGEQEIRDLMSACRRRPVSASAFLDTASRVIRPQCDAP